ncbi:hypothetical protein RMHFA_05693 [Roseomonas mucosa]|nr:hypothetical protein RMHFA_05693 [Roseomonas mucosa]
MAGPGGRNGNRRGGAFRANLRRKPGDDGKAIGYRNWHGNLPRPAGAPGKAVGRAPNA